MIKLDLEIKDITDYIKNAKDIRDSEVLFSYLSEIDKYKKQINEFLEEFGRLETEVKQQINDKAKALYGTNWQAIAGDKYKITRSFAGAIYEASNIDRVADEYKKVNISLNSGAIDQYIREKEMLPEGIDYNPNRSEVIKINVS